MMKQMCQCNRCHTLSKINQAVCPQCGENLILNGSIVNVDESGEIHDMEYTQSRPINVIYDAGSEKQVNFENKKNRKIHAGMIIFIFIIIAVIAYFGAQMIFG